MNEFDFISPQDPYIDQVIGDEFRIEKGIGVGGMGTVYRAVQSVTDRFVAIKIIHRHLMCPDLIKRFKQEAQIISKLAHPNIVVVYKYGQDKYGSLYIAMEFIEGPILNRLVPRPRSMEVKRALPLMIQMTDAVAYAHDHKIVHRDIKPENICVARMGRTEAVKILDFGIAKILNSNFIVTKTGMLCGSPGYMSPEQWLQTRDIDGRTDIYSLGCVFYALLTGRLPFKGDNTWAYMEAHLKTKPPPPELITPSLANAPGLSDLVTKCIQPDRNDRFPDAYALLEALKAVQTRLDSGSLRQNPLLEPSRPPEALEANPIQIDSVSTILNAPEPSKAVSPPSEAPPIPPPISCPPLSPLEEPKTPAPEVVTLREEISVRYEGGKPVYALRGFTDPQILQTERTPRAKKTHLLLVIAGCVAILFLACSLVLLIMQERANKTGADQGAPQSPQTVPVHHNEGPAGLILPGTPGLERHAAHVGHKIPFSSRLGG